MTVIFTKDQQRVELVHGDAACAPGTIGGLRLNTTALWIRINRGQWQRLKSRGITYAIDTLRNKELKDALEELL